MTQGGSCERCCETFSDKREDFIDIKYLKMLRESAPDEDAELILISFVLHQTGNNKESYNDNIYIYNYLIFYIFLQRSRHPTVVKVVETL